MTCANCRADLPLGQGGRVGGRWICCAHCLFHPLGCRCRYGELGIAETFLDPDPEPLP
jgi:hypothetical protein